MTRRGLLKSRAPTLHETVTLGFPALGTHLVKRAWLQVLDRRDERSSPRNLAQIDFADLKLLQIILTLGQNRTVRSYDSASTPELQTLLNTNPVNIGEVDSVLIARLKQKLSKNLRLNPGLAEIQ